MVSPKKSAHAELKQLENLRSAKVIDTDLYHKCLVEQAYKFFKDGDQDGCTLAIGKCDPNYFKTKMLQHMETDHVFNEIVIYLAYKFVQTGFSELGENIEPTQTKGSA